MPVKVQGGREYFTVAERVKAIHDAYPGRVSIKTLIRDHKPGDGNGKLSWCIMEATVVIRGDDGQHAQSFTGHAHEVESTDRKSANHRSFIENCETSAIGRALAAAGFAGKEYASADEMKKALDAESGAEALRADKRDLENRIREIQAQKPPAVFAEADAIVCNLLETITDKEARQSALIRRAHDIAGDDADGIIAAVPQPWTRAHAALIIAGCLIKEEK